MSVSRIALDAGRATAFVLAFEKRHAYMHAEGIDMLIGGEESMPLPGCPECGVPAERWSWFTYEDDGDGEALHIDVESCGHRFRTAPVPEQFW
jgi:hypothetical protein